MTDDLRSKIQDKQSAFRDYSYKAMEFDSFDSDKGEARFNIGGANAGFESGILDINQNKWTFEPKGNVEIGLAKSPFCNPNYSFENNGGKFGKLGCKEEGLANDRYRWTEIAGNKDGNYTDSKIEQEDKRVAYFRQAENGLYVRMALLDLMLDKK